MPTSAIQTGCVDLVLRPAEIALELAKIARHPYFSGSSEGELAAPASAEQALSKIFELLNNVYQADTQLAFGIDVVTRLCERLLQGGSPGIHFYALNQSALTLEIARRLGY